MKNFHYVFGDGKIILQDAIMTEDEAIRANGEETGPDLYWAKAHPVNDCPTCTGVI